MAQRLASDRVAHLTLVKTRRVKAVRRQPAGRQDIQDLVRVRGEQHEGAELIGAEEIIDPDPVERAADLDVVRLGMQDQAVVEQRTDIGLTVGRKPRVPKSPMAVNTPGPLRVGPAGTLLAGHGEPELIQNVRNEDTRQLRRQVVDGILFDAVVADSLRGPRALRIPDAHGIRALAAAVVVAHHELAPARVLVVEARRQGDGVVRRLEGLFQACEVIERLRAAAAIGNIQEREFDVSGAGAALPLDGEEPERGVSLGRPASRASELPQVLKHLGPERVGQAQARMAHFGRTHPRAVRCRPTSWTR